VANCTDTRVLKPNQGAKVGNLARIAFPKFLRFNATFPNLLARNHLGFKSRRSREFLIALAKFQLFEHDWATTFASTFRNWLFAKAAQPDRADSSNCELFTANPVLETWANVRPKSQL